jgi:S-DNA-T family DNA segregation ATPase FtsK/SpoIIIE
MSDQLPAVPGDGKPEPSHPVLPAVPADTSYEIDLDPAPSGQAVYVDITRPEGARLPVIPAHLRTRAGVQTALVRQAGMHGHRAAYHAVRSPRYLLLALMWAVVGMFMLIARQIGWWWVREQAELRADAVIAGDSREWRTLHKHAQETRRVRGLVLLGELAAVVAGCAALARLAPWWAGALTAAVALPLLAVAGRPADRKILHPAVVTARFRKLTADIVLRAYYAAGLGHPEKPDQQVMFGGPMHRDGEGSRVLVDLPYGKTLKDAVQAKDGIASGLDVQTSQVFIHRDPTSTRRHVLWVADRDPLAVPVGRTPLLAGKATDIWQPAPIGLDERGGLVSVPVLWNSLLVGALPRQGKTFAARLLALYAALDPYCRLDVFDGKGSPDWRKFALVADSFAFGLTPTRYGMPPEILLATLEELKADVQNRYARLSELPPDICPEGKLTREIARDPKFGMPVRLLVIDEVQEYYDLGEISRQIAALMVFLVKVAPGAGVSLIAATQKPSGIGGSGPVAQQFTSMRDNMAVRFSLRTSSYQVSEMVLGQGAYSEGLDSSTLLPQYKGVGILRGASDASPTVRTYLADAGDTERILTVARSLRQAAGTLSGMALGEAEPVTVSVAADVLAAWPAGTAGAHWEVLAGLLRAKFPDRHADATAESVSAMCRAAGIASVDVKYLGRTLKGCRRADAEAATR